MYWDDFLICSAAFLILSVVLAALSVNVKNKNKLFAPIYMLFMGVVVSSVLLYIPIFYNSYKAMGGGVFEAIYDSVFSAFGLFGFDGELGKIIPDIAELRPEIYNGYIILFSIIYILAPILTVGYILSFFNSISSYISYIFNFNSEVYVFSELNEKSYELAKSLIDSKDKQRFIIFANVINEKKNKNRYAKKVKEIGAVYFKKDITELKLSFHNKLREIKFFAIGDDEAKNTSTSLELIKKYKARDNTSLYVFAKGSEAELLFSNVLGNGNNEKIGLKVRRINVARSLISRLLYEEGYEKIFLSASSTESGTKNISAVVVGKGQCATEMTKALPWFCQMDGYNVSVNLLTPDKSAYERFASECPELIEYSGCETEGDAQYTLKIHTRIEYDTAIFDRAVTDLPEVTYVFVDSGNDEDNIRIAIKMRALCTRSGWNPVIQAVISNSNKKKALQGITNYRAQKYDIDFVGDLSSSYSEKVILGSDVEIEALKRHLKWGEEKEFWKYDYNYNSSVASAIHSKMKNLCKVKGFDKAAEERTEEETRNLRILEHRRWNAYIRSEGYVYGGTVEKAGRNDLAKLHNCLVPFDELPLEEQIKDD